MRLLLLASLSLALAGCIEPAIHPPPEHEPAREAPASPYVGQEAREIKALSSDEVDGYRRGAGLGYAKPAELNAYPGPLHALELRTRLGLDAGQVNALTAIRQEMLDAVIPLGEQFLAVEGEIEQRFRDDAMTPEALDALLRESARIESAIRYAHLAAHIETKAVLTPHQVAVYDEARGYGVADHSAHRHE